MDTCICLAESLRFSPQTITTLTVGYTPVQNKKFKKKKCKSGLLLIREDCVEEVTMALTLE